MQRPDLAQQHPGPHPQFHHDPHGAESNEQCGDFPRRPAPRRLARGRARPNLRRRNRHPPSRDPRNRDPPSPHPRNRHRPNQQPRDRHRQNQRPRNQQRRSQQPRNQHQPNQQPRNRHQRNQRPRNQQPPNRSRPSRQSPSRPRCRDRSNWCRAARPIQQSRCRVQRRVRRNRPRVPNPTPPNLRPRRNRVRRIRQRLPNPVRPNRRRRPCSRRTKRPPRRRVRESLGPAAIRGPWRKRSTRGRAAGLDPRAVCHPVAQGRRRNRVAQNRLQLRLVPPRGMCDQRPCASLPLFVQRRSVPGRNTSSGTFDGRVLIVNPHPEPRRKRMGAYGDTPSDSRRAPLGLAQTSLGGLISRPANKLRGPPPPAERPQRRWIYARKTLPDAVRFSPRTAGAKGSTPGTRRRTQSASARARLERRRATPTGRCRTKSGFSPAHSRSEGETLPAHAARRSPPSAPRTTGAKGKHSRQTLPDRVCFQPRARPERRRGTPTGRRRTASTFSPRTTGAKKRYAPATLPDRARLSPAHGRRGRRRYAQAP